MEKLIKITARMIDGGKEKFRTTSFDVRSSRDGERLYVKLNDNSTFVCKSIQVKQNQEDFVLTHSPVEEIQK